MPQAKGVARHDGPHNGRGPKYIFIKNRRERDCLRCGEPMGIVDKDQWVCPLCRKINREERPEVLYGNMKRTHSDILSIAYTENLPMHVQRAKNRKRGAANGLLTQKIRSKIEKQEYDYV